MRNLRFWNKDLGSKRYIIYFSIFLSICFSLMFSFKSLISFIPWVFADQTVSATVPPRASDYQFNFIASDNQTIFNQGTTMTYQITYGVKQSAGVTSDTTITVSFSNDLAPNNAHLLEYVQGSASDAYGGVKPVIDIINRTITWTIPNLPAGTTDQTLTFQLKALNVYPQSIPFTLTSSMSNQYLTLLDQVVTQYYRYQTPQLGPTATPGPQPTIPVTPTPSAPPPPHYVVGIPGISQNGANVAIVTAYPSKLSISYGTSPTNLSHTISSNDYTYQNSLTFPDLAPDTKYYFKFTITSIWGYSTNSDIYTFHTAKASSLPSVDNNIIVFSANGTVYFSDTQKQNTNSQPSVILTNDNNYEISYMLTKPTQVKTIEAVVINKILGTKTNAPIALPNDLIFPMQEKEPNLYVADINAITTGLYEVYVRITDKNGNILQKKITDLKVMPRFIVYAKDTDKPLQDARVFLSYFDNQTNSYRPLTQKQLGNIPNPGYTNETGQLAFTLPAGRYRVEESALLYNKVITDFTIGPGINQNYPVIYLSRDPFNLAALTTFSGNYLADTWTKLVVTLQAYASSIRLFHLFAVAVLGSFIIMNYLLFTMRSQIKAHHLPVFFLFHVDRMLNRHQQKYIYGTITDENNKPISQALIEFEDRDTRKIVAQIFTNKMGRFYCRNNYAGEINLLLSKPGYEVTTIPVNTLSLPERGLHLTLKKGTEQYHSAMAHVKEGITESFGILFETSLVITIILELLFFSIYGFTKTSPYLLLSIINILLWVFYVHEHSQKTNV